MNVADLERLRALRDRLVGEVWERYLRGEHSPTVKALCTTAKLLSTEIKALETVSRATADVADAEPG
jgi:hypothetical protein